MVFINNSENQTIVQSLWFYLQVSNVRVFISFKGILLWNSAFLLHGKTNELLLPCQSASTSMIIYY